jgi:hypothetical protein
MFMYLLGGMGDNIKMDLKEIGCGLMTGFIYCGIGTSGGLL